MSTDTTTQKSPSTPRGRVLGAAIKVTEADRNREYGDPKPNLETTANFWNLYLNLPPEHEIVATDVAVMMTLLKVARLMVTPTHADSYVDACAYMAIAAECSGVGNE